MNSFLVHFAASFNSSSVVISLGSEEYRQEFHRDDLVYPLKHPTKQQSVVTVIWALDDFTAENGATLGLLFEVAAPRTKSVSCDTARNRKGLVSRFAKIDWIYYP